MNFVLNHKYSDGNTPIRAEEADQLIPRISTMGELNEYEALNILQTREWAFDNRTMKSMDPLEESYIRELHRRMFENVWKWAGTYRKHELNIGCDPREIPQRIPQLIGNVRYWLDHKTFPVDECLIRFHHQLVSKIHPFPNGNGRHARLITDVVAVKLGLPEFTWGAGKDLVAEGDARTRYLVALRAFDANENDVKSLVEFARS
ncbi:MAG TPA: mobile mystery protein B [Blastocatellia bacterium]|nr:mobile mystery protein B [Candidatus Acidoferrum sp.]HKF59588.1 mobile mystery protein B [Blastocatellia bacterium]